MWLIKLVKINTKKRRRKIPYLKKKNWDNDIKKKKLVLTCFVTNMLMGGGVGGRGKSRNRRQ